MGALDRFGDGRTCLVAAPAGAPELAAALVRAGFVPSLARDERQALAEVARGAAAALYVAQALGPAALKTLLAASGQRCPDAPVVVLGATGTVQEAVDAMQLGAADYVPPRHDPDAAVRRLAVLLARVRRGGEEAPQGLPGIVGTSPAMIRLYDSVERISRYKSNVLLLGESGTGKELIARALHDRGPRRRHLFVPVNCATLGREILENELFGHERGAFTGANERKRGLFELADGGTFFLDEIAEMDVSTQAKLLRVLERNEFRRVGGTAKVKVDLSVIAATNRNLEEAIAAGRFREDLYYRLKVVTLVVPPLRARRADIPALVDAFVADFNRRMGGRIAGLEPAALRRLEELDWPGNVRELRNAVEGACVLASGEIVTLADLDRAALSPARPATRGARAPPGPGRGPRPRARQAARAVPRRARGRGGDPGGLHARRGGAAHRPRRAPAPRHPRPRGPRPRHRPAHALLEARGLGGGRCRIGMIDAAPPPGAGRPGAADPGIPADSPVARFMLHRDGVPRLPPPPSVLLLARPGLESDELFSDLVLREDLCLVRVATAAAAARTLAEMPVALVVAGPETPAEAVDEVLAAVVRSRPGTPVLAIRARQAPEPAGWGRAGVAVLRMPLLAGVLSRSIDVVLGMNPAAKTGRRGR